MIWLALYFSPVGLLFFFALYSVGKRTGIKAIEYVGMLGLPSDVFHAYTWFRPLLGAWSWDFPGLQGRDLWKARTVTALAGQRAKEGHKWAILLCRFLNWADPGHVRL
jgi:hypothetical protein